MKFQTCVLRNIKEVRLCWFQFCQLMCRSQMCSTAFHFLYIYIYIHTILSKLGLSIFSDGTSYTKTNIQIRYICMCVRVCVCVCFCVFFCFSVILMSAWRQFQLTIFSNYSTKIYMQYPLHLTCCMIHPKISSLFTNPRNIVICASHVASHLSNSTRPPLTRPS